MPLAIESLQDKLNRDHQTNSFDSTIWPDILAAVEELHRLGYVHRDLKPANILNVGGKWVISDFGLILPTMRDTTVLTSTHSAYGSHFYASPEQAADFRHTPEQADIFALGCILHDAIEPTASRIPFSQIRIVGDYGPIIEKCTEFDPRRRFPNVSSTAFAFEYCDVVGDRLLAAYKVATVRLQLLIVLETLELAVSHNRWHVMRQAGGMLSTTADDGLVDRLLIESQLDDNIPRQLRAIEHIIHWSRKLWHERIKTFLDNKDAPF